MSDIDFLIKTIYTNYIIIFLLRIVSLFAVTFVCKVTFYQQLRKNTIHLMN